MANPSPVDLQPNADEAFLAADVGGTHVRIARVTATGLARQPVAIFDYRKYACADYPGLGEIVQDFLRSLPAPVSRGVIASAGFPLDDGTVITANLPWSLHPERIRQQAGLLELRLVNDFQAVAYAAAQVDASQVLQLTGPEQGPAGPQLVLGPGTGLGAAVWIPAQPRPIVLPTEAGQAALAGGNELEITLIRHLLRERGHVSIEHALSGPGLLNLYRALCALRQVQPTLVAPGDITAAALANSDEHAYDEHAHDALQVFCALLGSVVGDLALLYGIQGGIYLAGGILPQIRDFLPTSDFVPRFLNKGPMRQALERIPVKLVEHGQLGVIGAASWYLDQTGSR
nr:glucokinase family protein [Pseudoxanthomonas indica]